MVKVLDDNGAEVGAQITLTEPQVLDFGFTVSTYQNGYNVSCYQCSNGEVDANPTGGVSPYSYLWNTGETTATVSNKSAGNFQVRITDANGCMVEGEINLTRPDRDDWTMLGNSGSDPSTQFMGTIDNKDFVFRTNNTERLRLMANGVINVDGALKIDSVSSDSSRSVFVDQNGMLKVNHSGGEIGVPCGRNTSRWYTDYCSFSNDIYNSPISGKVGIGTPTPSEKLEVIGNIKLSGNIITTGANSSLNINDLHVLNKIEVGSSIWLGGTNSGSATNDIFTDNDHLYINCNSAHHFNTLLNSNGGKVGIGSTTTPIQTLDVHGGMHISNGIIQKGGLSAVTTTGDLGLYSLDQYSYMRFVTNNKPILFFTDLTNGIASSGSGSVFAIEPSGNIGIGTDYPISLFGNSSDSKVLHIKSTIPTIRLEDDFVETGTTSKTDFEITATNGAGRLISSNSVAIFLDADNNETDEAFRIIKNNNSLSGAAVELFKVNEQGIASARGVKVTMGSFPDYVFDKNYSLKSLKEIEEYIYRNRHLPGIPSCDDVKRGGLDLGEMQSKLVEKIEELTLYMIDLQKQIEKLKSN